MATIDVGCDNQTGFNNGGTGHTMFNLTNPANDTGTITSVTVYCVADVAGLVVGTAYGSGTSWTKRDYETIGNASAGANTFTGLSIDVSTNDIIGEYHSAGKVYYSSNVGGNGYIYKLSTNTFGLSGAQTYTADTATGIKLSVYGTGATAGGGATPTPSVNDSSSITENIGLLFSDRRISSSDSATLSENLSIHRSQLFATVNDSISATESNTQYLKQKYLSVFDSISAADLNNLNISELFSSTYDSSSLSENISLYIKQLYIYPAIYLLDDEGNLLTDEDGNYIIVDEYGLEDISINDVPTVLLGQPAVSEDVEITVNDSLDFSELINIGFAQQYINVFDSISAAEEITKYLAQDYISISDSINIDESIIVTFASLNINVNDSVNTTESINEYLAQKYISVNDSVNLSENISRIFGQQYITGIYDDVSVSENLGINRSQLFITSLDSLNLLEENSLSFAGSVYASVFDSINVDESINKRFGQVLINSNDSITFSESQSLRYGQLNIQPYESIGLSESNAFVFSGPRYITVDDSIGNVDVVNTVFGQLYIKSFDYLVDEEGNYLTDEDGNKLIFTTNIYDGVGFTENVSFGTTEAYRSISVYDGIDLSEDISQYSGQRQISSFESIGLSESLSSYFQPQNINVSESIAVSENLTPVFGQLYLKTVVYLTDEDGNYLTDEDGNRILFDSAIFDSISVDDAPSVSTFQLKPTLYDSISIDELVMLSTVRPLYIGATNYFTDEAGNRLTDEAGNYLVSSESIFETLGITESISLSRSAVTSLSASINDSISITEDVNTGYIVEDIGIIFDRLISVSDSIAFDEYFNGLRTPVIEKYDTIGLTDSASVYAGIKSYQSIFVYDDVSLAEYLNFTNVVEDIELLLDVDARVDDSISINESIALNRSAGYNEIKVSDTITPEEFIASYLSSHKISVYDEVGVAEANFASTGLTIKMVEDIGILESTAQYFRQKYVDTSDSLSIDDSANLSLNNNINANDSISVDESISVRFNYLELISSDSITLNDANSVIRSPELIAFYDTIGVSESIALRFRHLMINSNESIGMDESTNLSLRTFRPFWAAGANVIIQPGV